MQKPKVKRMFVMPDGEVKHEHELTPKELDKVYQKFVDVLTPLAYEAVVQDLKENGCFGTGGK